MMSNTGVIAAVRINGGLKLALVVLIVGLIFWGVRRYRTLRRRPVQVQERSVSWRILMGALGVGIVAVMAAVTLSDVDQLYAEPDRNRTVKVPTLPEPELVLGEDGVVQNVTGEHTKVLVDLVMIDVSYGTELLHVEQFEFTNTDEPMPLQKTISLAIPQLNATLTILSPSLRLDDDGNTRLHAHIQTRFQHSTRVATPGHFRGHLKNRQRVASANLRGFGGTRTPLTLSDPPWGPEVRVFLFFRAIDADDPMETIDGDTYFEQMSPMPEGQLDDSIQRLMDRKILPAIGLLGWAEIATFPLLLAAFLIAQALPRRTTSMAWAFAFVIVATALIDRAALDQHLEVLKDNEATVRARGIAANRAAVSFFYRDTATEAIETAIDRNKDDRLTRTFEQALEQAHHYRHP